VTREEKAPVRRHARFPRTLAECVHPLTKQAFEKHGIMEARIIRDWAGIVGAEMAQMTLPQKLTFPRGRRAGGSLTVLAHPAIALALQHHTPVILERLSVYLGAKAVERVTIRQHYGGYAKDAGARTRSLPARKECKTRRRKMRIEMRRARGIIPSSSRVSLT
jgi:hypothetical protein